MIAGRALCRSVAAALPLAACVAGAPDDHDRIAAAMAMPTAVTVTLAEGDFSASLSDGPPGTMLTASGAVPVAGRTITVSRVPALGQSEGALAKRAAREGCAMMGGVLNEAAIGSYRAGTWVFAGGCA